MDILKFIGIGGLSFYFLWVHYLAVMKLQDEHTREPFKGVQFVTAKIVLVIGLLQDLFWQYIFATALWLELPKWGEHTVSARVKRLCSTGSGWRKRLAETIRDTWLKRYDRSGGHD